MLVSVGFHLFDRGRRPIGHQHDDRPLASPDCFQVGDGPVVAREVEAFLNGTLALLRACEHRTVAPWLVINHTAHADPTELRALADGTASPISLPGVTARDNRARRLVQRWVAEETIRLGPDATHIQHVQHQVLVPLELELIARSTTRRDVLGTVLADAIDALHDHRPRR
jgi:hypothetical protein